MFFLPPNTPGYYACIGVRDDGYGGEMGAGRKAPVLSPLRTYCDSRHFGLSLPHPTKIEFSPYAWLVMFAFA